MLADFGNWLLTLVIEFVAALWGLLVDVAVAVVDLIVSAFVALVTAIQVPDFISGGLASLWSMLDPGIVYVVSECGLPAALALLGAGYAFRILRKFATLFQW